MVSRADSVIFEKGIQLPVGGQLSGQSCPYCNAEEKSLSISRTERGIEYKCHRAKCGISGYTSTAGSSSTSTASMDANTKKKLDSRAKYQAFIKGSVLPDDGVKDWLWQTWKMETKHIRKGGIAYSPACNRLVLPIYSVAIQSAFGRVEVGNNLRSMDGSVSPKSLLYMNEPDALTMSHYEGPSDSDAVIVVEDQASAIRASMYCNSVALLGVYMDAIRGRVVGRLEKRVIFCLDDDAFDKGVLMAQRYGPMMQRGHKVVRPHKDLKNMTELELTKFMREECGVVNN